MSRCFELLAYIPLMAIVALAAPCAAESGWTEVWSSDDITKAESLERVSSVRMNEEMMAALIKAGTTTHLRLVNADNTTNEMWGALLKLKNLVHLELGNSLFEPGNFNGAGTSIVETTGLGYFSQIKTLETLICRGLTQSDPEDKFAWLKNMPNLKELRLIDVDVETEEGDYIGIGVPALETICTLTQLERLELDCLQLDDALAAKLAGLTNLKELKVRRCVMTDAGVELLAKLKNLEALDITCAGEGKFIAKFAHLKSFGCTVNGWPVDTLKPLKDWKGLRQLKLRGEIGIGVIPFAVSLSQLEALHLTVSRDGRKEELEGFSFSQLKALKRLYLDGVLVDDKQAASILGLTNLEKLSIRWPRLLTAKAMLGIDKLQNLRELSLERILHYDRGMQGTDVWVNDAVAAAIAKLPKLERLQLSGFSRIKLINGNQEFVDAHLALSLKALQELAKIKTLRYLSLSENGTLDKEASAVFVDMRQLKHLNVYDGFNRTALGDISRSRTDLRVSEWKPTPAPR